MGSVLGAANRGLGAFFRALAVAGAGADADGSGGRNSTESSCKSDVVGAACAGASGFGLGAGGSTSFWAEGKAMAGMGGGRRYTVTMAIVNPIKMPNIQPTATNSVMEMPFLDWVDVRLLGDSALGTAVLGGFCASVSAMVSKGDGPS